MRLRTLTGLERKKIEDEYEELIKLIAELEDILGSPRRVAGIVKSEALEMKRKANFGPLGDIAGCKALRESQLATSLASGRMPQVAQS